MAAAVPKMSVLDYLRDPLTLPEVDKFQYFRDEEVNGG